MQKPASLPLNQPKCVSVLGSTGSIGKSAVEVFKLNKGAFAIQALTAMENVELLAQQAKELNAKLAVIGNPQQYGALKEALAGSGIEAQAGAQALVEAAEMPADIVLAAIVGAAGLAPVLAALKKGTDIALANKECLVCAGELVVNTARAHNALLLPVDSEHSAIFQAIDPEHPEWVESITITASGGPFREWSAEQMQAATPAQAVKHPTWSMGAKISVDSATLMNKGLELIEAFYLFPLKEEQFKIVVHPESIVHAFVNYLDGSVLAQLSHPDMRTPIAHALAWPKRIPAGSHTLDITQVGRLTFTNLDTSRFPAPALARASLKAGNSAPAVLNAANEVAVNAFLQNRIGFLDIVKVVEKTLEKADNTPLFNFDEVMRADQEARRIAESFL